MTERHLYTIGSVWELTQQTDRNAAGTRFICHGWARNGDIRVSFPKKGHINIPFKDVMDAQLVYLPLQNNQYYVRDIDTGFYLGGTAKSLSFSYTRDAVTPFVHIERALFSVCRKVKLDEIEYVTPKWELVAHDVYRGTDTVQDIPIAWWRNIVRMDNALRTNSGVDQIVGVHDAVNNLQFDCPEYSHMVVLNFHSSYRKREQVEVKEELNNLGFPFAILSNIVMVTCGEDAILAKLICGKTATVVNL